MVLQGGAVVVPNLKDAVPYFSKVLANGSVLSPVENGEEGNPRELLEQVNVARRQQQLGGQGGDQDLVRAARTIGIIEEAAVLAGVDDVVVSISCTGPQHELPGLERPARGTGTERCKDRVIEHDLVPVDLEANDPVGVGRRSRHVAELKLVGSETSAKQICVRPPIQDVVPIAAVELVLTCPAQDAVVAIAPAQGIGTPATMDPVLARPAEDRVGTPIRDNGVVAPQAVEPVSQIAAS